jgi:hypothetical protein
VAVTKEGAAVRMLAAENARSLMKDGRTMFSAETPTSIAAQYGPHQIEAQLNSKNGAKIVLFVDDKPIRILLDGKEIGARAFSFDNVAGTIALNIPAGRHEIRMVLK